MKKLFLYSLLLLSGCNFEEAIVGGVASLAGARIASNEAKAWQAQLKAQEDNVSPQEVLEESRPAFQTFYTNVQAIWTNPTLPLKDKERAIRAQEKVLYKRLAYAQGLMVSDDDPVARALSALKESKETEEAFMLLGKMLPPPWNEIIPTLLGLGLTASTAIFVKKSVSNGKIAETYSSYAQTAGTVVELLKQRGAIHKDVVKEIGREATSRTGVNALAFTNFLKRHNVT